MSFRAPLEGLARAGVPFQFRKGVGSIEDLPPAGEVDLWLDPKDLPAAGSVIRSAGFVPIQTTFQGAHRFFVEMEGGQWRKLDVKLRGGRPRRSRIERAIRRVLIRLPRSVRRTGPVVAILGPDGAGKGTLVARLVDTIPLAVTPIYLGTGPRSSWPASPGSGVQADPSEATTGGRDGAGPARFTAREAAFILRKWIRGRWRLRRGYAAARRGHVVLCDRHPLEVLAVRPARSFAGGALERFLSTRLTPRPDAIVVLDASPEVLFERKPEHPVRTLDSWRRAYRDMFAPMGVTFVDTSGSVEDASRRVSEVVWSALRARRGL